MCFHCQEELSVYINLAETKKINSVFNGSQRFLEKVLQHRLSLSLELFLCLRPFVPQLPPFLFNCKTINVFKEHAVQKCSAKLGPFFSPCWQWQAFESTFEWGHLHHFCLFDSFAQYLVWGFIQCSFFELWLCLQPPQPTPPFATSTYQTDSQFLPHYPPLPAQSQQEWERQGHEVDSDLLGSTTGYEESDWINNGTRCRRKMPEKLIVCVFTGEMDRRCLACGNTGGKWATHPSRSRYRAPDTDREKGPGEAPSHQEDGFFPGRLLRIVN